MFGISFSELFVIAIVALLVIGPEKLPKVARTVGALTGRMQRYAAQVKEEVNREFRFEELQKLQEEIKQAVISTEQNVKQQVAKVENSIASLSENNTQQDKENIQTAVVRKPVIRKTRAKSAKTVADDLDKKSKREAKVSATKTTTSERAVRKSEKLADSKTPAEKVES